MQIIVDNDNFNIDKAVLTIFEHHPLRNAIFWEYFLTIGSGSDRGHNKYGASEEDIRQAVHGPDENIRRMIQGRVEEARRAPNVFWSLHQRYMCPSEKQITGWRKDYLAQITFINETFVKSDLPIFANHEAIREEMIKEWKSCVLRYSLLYCY